MKKPEDLLYPDYAIFDKRTGEIIGDLLPKKKGNRKHNHVYFLVFQGNLAAAGKAVHPSAGIILLEMDGNNFISLSSMAKKALCERHGITANLLKVTLTRMVKDGFLLHLGTNVYFANPWFFTKTNLKKIDALREKWGELSTIRKIRIVRKKEKSAVLRLVREVEGGF